MLRIQSRACPGHTWHQQALRVQQSATKLAPMSDRTHRGYLQAGAKAGHLGHAKGVRTGGSQLTGVSPNCTGLRSQIKNKTSQQPDGIIPWQGQNLTLHLAMQHRSEVYKLGLLPPELASTQPLSKLDGCTKISQVRKCCHAFSEQPQLRLPQLRLGKEHVKNARLQHLAGCAGAAQGCKM